ncbi:MAG: 2-C-methyl-D-erythritol 4-phosphate cytidylyltransferase [Phycisphaerales bacterium]|nr:2-C-methyl-D-erythritol 4-phosphate cytidylyltransferase [Phycisphaerales bacterium]
MKLCVILPAAGASTRFHGGDKLAADLGGRPVLLRTVEIFTRREEVSQVIVAGPPDDFDSFKDRFGAGLGFHGVSVVEGGRRDRWETVHKALQVVDPTCTHVAVHDAARPLVSDALLDRIMTAAETLDAIVPTVSMSSTLKEIDPEAGVDAGEGEDLVVDSILGEAGRLKVDAQPITRTVDRSRYAMAQTPQVFRRELLLEAYEGGPLEGVTDDAQVLEQQGHTVHAIEGEPTNIKITTAEDLRLAAALLGLAAPRRPRDPLLGG